MAKNYAKLTRQLTGMDEAAYKAEYTKFAARVRNYNAIAGTKYSAAKEFYYSKRYASAPSPALRGILATPATRARKAGAPALTTAAAKRVEKTATGVFLKTWEGWWKEAQAQAAFGGIASRSIAIKEALERGKISYDEADKRMRELAKERHTRTDKDPSFRY